MCEETTCCGNPERMTGKDTLDCSLRQIKECHPELFERIMGLVKEHRCERAQ